MSSAGRPSPVPYLMLCAVWLAGSVSIVGAGVQLWRHAATQGTFGVVVALVLTLITLAEVVGLFFLLGFMAKAAAYVTMREEQPPAPVATVPPTAVLYLTAGDFDPVAVDSLLRLDSPGEWIFVLHDDGNDDVARRRMSEFIDRHPCRDRWQVVIWHRPERLGGKAGAVNWVLARLDSRWELLLLCDSDSIALDTGAIAAAAGEFVDPTTAVVQFRNVGHVDPGDGVIPQRLALAIDVFDAFAAPQARWGYLPFFGHNALVRIAALRQLGGLTPGFFSDDLDLSVRLTLARLRIVYRRDIRFAERHPAEWASFRKRARKWAFGCMQVVRARLRDVLTRPGLPFAHRIGLLEFMGFYPAQALLLTGLLLGQLVLPWLAPAPRSTPAFVVSGALVTLALIAPTLAWAVRERRLAQWPAFAWVCALVYGGSILSTARGVLDGFSNRERPWIPTNLTARRRAVPLSAWGECLLGVMLFAVPWLTGSPAVAFAATYLFVATFLFAPLTYAAYREAPAKDAPAGPTDALGSAASRAASALCLSLALVASAHAEPAPRVTAKGHQLWLRGAPFEVRGIHYSPWLPGTGPDGHYPYPGRDRVERDLRSIRSLGVNTILVHSAPGWVMRLANEHDLRTIYAFHIQWNDTSRVAFDHQADGIVAAVDSLRAAPGLMAWMLGNEIPAWVVEVVGATELEARVRALASRVRGHDPDHLIGHGNWPPAKQLDLSFLDLACFNLYPAWPYEVTVRGFGPYLREVLVPLARGRPLLLTEFGINSLEAGEAHQAEVLADCWREIHASPTVGGVLFEWCDEWWKNYDNPVPGKGYWERRYDPDDAARADNDPEENYGITRTDRSPKAAFAAVQRMWSAPTPRRSLTPWLVLLGLAGATVVAFRIGRAPSRG